MNERNPTAVAEALRMAFHACLENNNITSHHAVEVIRVFRKLLGDDMDFLCRELIDAEREKLEAPK